MLTFRDNFLNAICEKRCKTMLAVVSRMVATR